MRKSRAVATIGGVGAVCLVAGYGLSRMQQSLGESDPQSKEKIEYQLEAGEDFVAQFPGLAQNSLLLARTEDGAIKLVAETTDEPNMIGRITCQVGGGLSILSGPLPETFGTVIMGSTDTELVDGICQDLVIGPDEWQYLVGFNPFDGPPADDMRVVSG
ncbi:MAG: hypothetical protein KIH63_001500 [Candidatus Saccharibacteria bacterium]|nr:hypothetical protein [Candidatus Saccharibacteria bacterium]